MSEQRSDVATNPGPGLGPRMADPGPAGRAVLVLGPEGAGLAALAGLLGRLGCDLPRDLVGVGPRDGQGAWESAAVAGLARPDPADARAALDTAFGPAPLPLLKGAALARALPAWLAALDASRRGAVAVLAFGLPPEGADEGTWDAWAQGALRAERASRGLLRAVCARDRLLADWRGEVEGLARTLGLAWPARVAGEASADAFVASARDAGVASSAAGPPGHAARLLAEVLARWAESGEDPADRPDLDRIARELGLDDDARPEAASPTAPETGDAALARAERARAEAEMHLAEAAALLARSERLRLDGEAAARARRAEAAGGSEDRVAGLEADLATARRERDQAASALRQRSREADEQALARAALEAALAEARAEHAADLQRMDRLRRDVAALKRDAMGELSARLARLPVAAPGEGRGDRRAAEAEAEALREAVATFGEPQVLAARLKEAERRAQEFGEGAQAELEAIRRSTSWRLTKPLRSVLGALRRG